VYVIALFIYVVSISEAGRNGMFDDVHVPQKQRILSGEMVALLVHTNICIVIYFPSGIISMDMCLNFRKTF
jgi:hypothetical protein